MADLVIRGMEIPTNVDDCPLNTFGYCNLAQDSTHTYCIGDSRPEWCPLVSLPEGHGRLGDLTEIEKKLQKTLDGMGDRWLSSPSMMAQRVAIVADLKKVKEAPTIIPAEGGTENEHV